MACYHLLEAWQKSCGKIVFRESADTVRSLILPCGQCYGCRLERSRQWAMRCLHEASLYKQNSFITLTYADEHLPQNGSLDYRDFQLFMKRLRKAFEGVRFYMCGEYGDKLGRPHFHACLFNIAFPDQKFLKITPAGETVYTSDTLRSLWGKGRVSIGDVTFESAAYVARYIMEKRNGQTAKTHYERLDQSTGEITNLTPEFTHMSLKPGIGHGWFEKFHKDVYPQDYVILRGKKVKPPKYYDRKITTLNPLTWELVENRRLEIMEASSEDNTPERLKVREEVAKAKMRHHKRSI